MLKLQFAATPTLASGLPTSEARWVSVRAGPDLVTLVGLKIITVVSRIQP